MTEVFTEEQTVMQVARLTRTRLTAFIRAEAVIPAHSDAGPVFGAADLARLDLLCELAELYDMEPEALAVMISVIDAMHAARRDRRALLEAIRREAPEVRARVAAALDRDREARSGERISARRDDRAAGSPWPVATSDDARRPRPSAGDGRDGADGA